MRTRSGIFAALLISGIVNGPARGQDIATPPGYFSSAATSLSRAYVDHQTVTVPSPDGRSRIVAHAERQGYVLSVEEGLDSRRCLSLMGLIPRFCGRQIRWRS